MVYLKGMRTRIGLNLEEGYNALVGLPASTLMIHMMLVITTTRGQLRIKMTKRRMRD